MANNEAAARIKINKLLEAAGWRFFAEGSKPANIRLEANATLKTQDINDLGENFEKISKGFIDFLLLNEKGFPLIVLEAKAESKDPLDGKEQARTYARSQNCRFVILSNGNLHFFWDLERRNPAIITTFPTPQSVEGYQDVTPNPKRLLEETVGKDYIVLSQRPGYASEAAWKNADERQAFIETNELRFLRDYQIRAIAALQKAVGKGSDRFLFVMATGTGKTLTTAAVIKLFLRTGNARRVLFLVDRLELEVQAKKAFEAVLKNDYKTIIYKETRDEWRRAEIVVTTVQSLLFNNKYTQLFSPTDFDLVISDEAHRSIGGNARAVFDYFVGYKLGLTATPRDYLKRFDKAQPTTRDPREFERRLLLDTYRTFGCDDGLPTFQYTLNEGATEGYLVQPIVVDARSEVTTQLLSDQGFVVEFTGEEGDEYKEAYTLSEFEKRFFAPGTNELFCKTFLENALRDPVSQEIGKSIVFAVSQNHARDLTQILNVMAHKMFPGKYQSDFAIQVTSRIPDAQQYTVNFTNNNLLGSANFLDSYKTSKARVCVTVGMMTTGYDCPDLLNIVLMRPLFSPTDFIQIKGRGTRKHCFTKDLQDAEMKANVAQPDKTVFKLFDFFANCQYFDDEFNYDEVLELPKLTAKSKNLRDEMQPPQTVGTYTHAGADILATIKEETIGYDGMKVDRMFFEKFENAVRDNAEIAAAVEAGEWERVIEYVRTEVFEKPNEYYTLDKLRKAAAVDRRLGLREILEKIFGLIPRFKSKDELLEEEFAKFIADAKPTETADIPAMRNYFKAYVTSDKLRGIIEANEYSALYTNPIFSMQDYKAVPQAYRTRIPEYVKDYVTLNQFAT